MRVSLDEYKLTKLKAYQTPPPVVPVIDYRSPSSPWLHLLRQPHHHHHHYHYLCCPNHRLRPLADQEVLLCPVAWSKEARSEKWGPDWSSEQHVWGLHRGDPFAKINTFSSISIFFKIFSSISIFSRIALKNNRDIDLFQNVIINIDLIVNRYLQSSDIPNININPTPRTLQKDVHPKCPSISILDFLYQYINFLKSSFIKFLINHLINIDIFKHNLDIIIESANIPIIDILNTPRVAGLWVTQICTLDPIQHCLLPLAHQAKQEAKIGSDCFIAWHWQIKKWHQRCM